MLAVEDDGMHEPRTMAGETLRRLFGQNIIYITDRMRSPNCKCHMWVYKMYVIAVIYFTYFFPHENDFLF